jgi:serine/threonine-protein kinase HipA
MNRSGNVYVKQVFCGVIQENENGYSFQYESAYLSNDFAQAVSLTLPLVETSYHSKTLFAFFDGLIPEGWLLGHSSKKLESQPSETGWVLLLRVVKIV